MEPTGDIAVIGLAVMGQNIVLNMNDHGFTVVAANRTVKAVDDFLANEAKGTNILGAHSYAEMVKMLKKPRRIMLLVKAGSPVDQTIEQIIPMLDEGDIIIDGGNSEYLDTNRRVARCLEKGVYFVGCGVSGGEEGARHGPSLMPGGHPAAWPHLKDIFQAIAAKSENEPCCDWVGEAGSGHFVKMVHNGIEYGDMQLIAEAYDLMHRGLGLKHDDISDVFADWNRGELDSFLIEITTNILKFRDETGETLLPKIRDAAGQKGTGKWTCLAAFEYGQPVTLISEAVMARSLSALKNERAIASQRLKKRTACVNEIVPDMRSFIKAVGQALYASKVVSYTQGFMLLRAASQELKWNLNYGAIALMWRGGCIIRSRFLGEIKKAFDKNPQLSNLLLDDFFAKAVEDAQQSWRTVVATGVRLGIPLPTMSAALSFFDGYTSDMLPANLLQAQRDYFGHCFQHHSNWTGHGGRVTSNVYQA